MKSAWPRLAWYWLVAVCRKAGRKGSLPGSTVHWRGSARWRWSAGPFQVWPGVSEEGGELLLIRRQTPGLGTFAAPYYRWRRRKAWPSRWRCCKARRTGCPSWSPVGYRGSGRTGVAINHGLDLRGSGHGRKSKVKPRRASSVFFILCARWLKMREIYTAWAAAVGSTAEDKCA